MASCRGGLVFALHACMASGNASPVSVVHDVWKERSRALTSTQDSGREVS